MANERSNQPKSAGGGSGAGRDKLQDAVARAVQDLEARLAATGGDPCLNAVYLALQDASVQAAFVKHAGDQEVFRNALCLGSFIPEEERIVFEFLCLPPKICLFPQRFLVRLNVVAGTVAEVVDPAPDLVPVNEQQPDTMYRL